MGVGREGLIWGWHFVRTLKYKGQPQKGYGKSIRQKGVHKPGSQSKRSPMWLAILKPLLKIYVVSGTSPQDGL